MFEEMQSYVHEAKAITDYATVSACSSPIKHLNATRVCFRPQILLGTEPDSRPLAQNAASQQENPQERRMTEDPLNLKVQLIKQQEAYEKRSDTWSGP